MGFYMKNKTERNLEICSCGFDAIIIKPRCMEYVPCATYVPSSGIEIKHQEGGDSLIDEGCRARIYEVNSRDEASAVDQIAKNIGNRNFGITGSEVFFNPGVHYNDYRFRVECDDFELIPDGAPYPCVRLDENDNDDYVDTESSERIRDSRDLICWIIGVVDMWQAGDVESEAALELISSKIAEKVEGI